MPYKEYNTKWTEKLPLFGVECPVCQKGILDPNNFTGKDGKEWQSVKCESCFTKWILSKKRYPASQKEKEPSVAQPISSQGASVGELEKKRDLIQEIKEGAEIILTLLKEIRDIEQNIVKLEIEKRERITSKETKLITEDIEPMTNGVPLPGYTIEEASPQAAKKYKKCKEQ